MIKDGHAQLQVSYGRADAKRQTFRLFFGLRALITQPVTCGELFCNSLYTELLGARFSVLLTRLCLDVLLESPPGY